jgi:hypothetical protein
LQGEHSGEWSLPIKHKSIGKSRRADKKVGMRNPANGCFLR